MKKSSLVLKIVSLVFLGIAGLVSLIYLAFELRLLFSGDLAIYSNVVPGVFDTIFAVIRNLFILSTVVIIYLYLLLTKISLKLKYFAITLGFAGILLGLIMCIFDGLWFSEGVEGYIAIALKLTLIIGSILFSINEYRKLKGIA